MPYTVRLLSLKCLVSQENNGDEIYLTLNGQTVWSVTGDYALHQQPRLPHQIKEVDFVQGRWLTAKGWETIPDFDVAQFVFGGLTGENRFEVWDQDNFSRDDYFGIALFAEDDIRTGQITAVAARDGAHYVLTFATEMER
jgi:hypothetical protein